MHAEGGSPREGAQQNRFGGTAVLYGSTSGVGLLTPHPNETMVAMAMVATVATRLGILTRARGGVVVRACPASVR